MDNHLPLSLDFDLYTESLPEGEFHVVKIETVDGPIYGKHRGGPPMAMALAFEQLASYTRKEFYKRKAEDDAKVDDPAAQ